jgi:hypothetical protein
VSLKNSLLRLTGRVTQRVPCRESNLKMQQQHRTQATRVCFGFCFPAVSYFCPQPRARAVIRLIPPKSYSESGPIEAGVSVYPLNVPSDKALWVKLPPRVATLYRSHTGVFISDESGTNGALHEMLKQFTAHKIFDSFEDACQAAVIDRLAADFGDGKNTCRVEASGAMDGYFFWAFVFAAVSVMLGFAVSGFGAQYLLPNLVNNTSNNIHNNKTIEPIMGDVSDFPWVIVGATAGAVGFCALCFLVMELCSACGNLKILKKEHSDWYLLQPWSVTWYAYMLVTAVCGVHWVHTRRCTLWIRYGAAVPHSGHWVDGCAIHGATQTNPLSCTMAQVNHDLECDTHVCVCVCVCVCVLHLRCCWWRRWFAERQLLQLSFSFQHCTFGLHQQARSSGQLCACGFV